MRWGPPEPWESFADGVLRREALSCRVARGAPRDLPGLYVDDADADRLLAELPGLIGLPDADPRIAPLDAFVGALRAAFRDSLGSSSRFADVVRHARLSPDEAEALA